MFLFRCSVWDNHESHMMRGTYEGCDLYHRINEFLRTRVSVYLDTRRRMVSDNKAALKNQNRFAPARALRVHAYKSVK